MSWTPPRSIRYAVHRTKCAMVSRTSIGPKEAAERVGRSKSAILKAIREGRISATKSDSGSWHIEPVELFRAYRDRGSESTQAPHTSAHKVGNITLYGPQEIGRANVGHPVTNANLECSIQLDKKNR